MNSDLRNGSFDFQVEHVVKEDDFVIKSKDPIHVCSSRIFLKEEVHFIRGYLQIP